MRRMDRYEEAENPNKVSRADNNKELYQNVGRNTRYTNISDVTNANAYDISNIDRNNRTRENYQKVREYSNLIPGPKVKRELDEFKNIHKEKENRVYDINSVMAEARKNRKDPDDIEKRRKLKNDKYNILLSMTKEELEEYRRLRKERYTHPDEEELHELIDTIASKTLAGEIDKNTSVNLLSELMATSIMDKVEKPNKENKILEEIDKNNENVDEAKEDEDLKNTSPVKMEYDNKEDDLKEEIEESDDVVAIDDENQDQSFITDEKINPEQLCLLNEELDKKEGENASIDGVDSDFYTKSINLTSSDFESEMDDEFREKTLPLPLKIIIFLIILAVIAVAGYYIYKML